MRLRETSQKISDTLMYTLLIFAVFFPRLANLGTSLTIDEPLWIDRGKAYIGRIATLNISDAIPSIQPGVTTSWIAGFVSSFQSLAISQASIAISSGVLILIAAYFLITLLGKKWGFVTAFLVALEPFLVAHGRVVHTDSLLALFMLLSLLSILVYGEYLLSKKESPTRYIAASGVFIGLAILTKIFALALLLPLGAITLYYHWKSATLNRAIPSLLILSTTALVTLLIVWPTLIINFNGVIHQLGDRVTDYAEGTRDGEVTAKWWYYPREIYFRATPILTIFLVPSLLLFFRSSSKEKRIFGILVVSGIFYAIVLSLRGEKSDRYVLLTILTLSIFSIVGVKFLLTWLAQEWPRLKGKESVIAGTSIALTLLILNLNALPYPLAYYNPLYPIEETHKLGWGEGLEQAAQWLSQHHPQAPVATYYPRVFSFFYTGQGQVESLQHISESETSYVVLYRSMFERGPDAPESDILQEYLYSGQESVHAISINGLPYVWIYKHPAPN